MDILQNYCPSTLYPFFWQLFTTRNKWFMISYGSVSAGREFRLFYVTFFLKVEPPCDQTWWVIPFVQLLVVYHIFLVPRTPWLDLCGHFKVPLLVPIILEIVWRWFSLFWFISSSSRTWARAVWSFGVWELMPLAMMMICCTFISQTSNSSSSGSRQAREELKKRKIIYIQFPRWWAH